MKRERIKLRPTGLWILFGPILACMWLAAVNYSNNLVYAVLYLIGSLTFVSLFHTWRNLAGLEIDHIRVHSGFAEAEIRMEVHFRNSTAHGVYGLYFAGRQEGLVKPLTLPSGSVMRVLAGDTCSADLFFPSARRGKYRIDSLLVRSSFPFGLVSGSFQLPMQAVYFVYPQQRGERTFPKLAAAGENGAVANQRPGDDFAGVRSYAPGESLRHVDWKAFARGRPMSVKQFTGGEEEELWLDTAQTMDLPWEEGLSQLALWVVTAERENIPYGLRNGETSLPLGLGPEHARHALEVLAVAGSPRERVE